MATVTITCKCGAVDSGPDTQALLDKGWKEVIFCHCPTCECCDFFCPNCVPQTDRPAVKWSDDAGPMPVYDESKPAPPHID